MTTTATPLKNAAMKPPTSEVGAVTAAGVVPWANLGYIDQQEHVPDLFWPNSVRTYNVMRKDAQIHGLLQGMTLPIRRYRWVVDPNGTPPEVYQKLAADLNLPIKGEEDQPRGRSKGRFKFDHFLRHALLALPFGHMFFELSGDYMDSDSLWHLTRVSERMPHTITEVDVDTNGDLNFIKQAVGIQAPEIPADRLAPFIWEREGGNWLGTSMIRPMYKLWLIKDRVIRVNAISLERNGMGVPVIEAPPNATRGQMISLNQMAQAFKVGESAGGAIPAGSRLTLEGVRGTLPDALKTWQACNEEMSRSLLMMFIELGQTRTGSRALGSEFIDYFQLSQESVAIWAAETISEEINEKWQWWNFGDQHDTSPLINFERNEEPELAVADLAQMVNAGVIHMDPELEDMLRDRYMLPDIPPDRVGLFYPTEIPSIPSPGDPIQQPVETPAPGIDNRTTSAGGSGGSGPVRAAAATSPGLPPGRSLLPSKRRRRSSARISKR